MDNTRVNWAIYTRQVNTMHTGMYSFIKEEGTLQRKRIVPAYSVGYL
jgi:hypothetical protein